MSDTITKFDNYLSPDGPAALVIREHLMPVEGADGVFFPATFANIGYNIDGDDLNRNPDGKNIALIDSVGSQANRIEPMFSEGVYAKLVPQITIQAGEKLINLLDAGHRAGDAIARCSALKNDLQSAFKEILKGNAQPLAKIAPTSLVFGVWDSRDTQAKLPRLISSTVRAYNVRKLTRSAQYTPATEYVAERLLPEPEKKEEKDCYAERGFIHVPAIGSHGGIIAEGGTRRDAVLAISALKLLKASDDDETKKLQRYILSLALVAFTKLPLGYYRQGSILVLDPGKQREFSEVALNGRRTPSVVTHEDALAFAQAAAEAFGIGQDQAINFDPETAKKDLKDKEEKKGGKKGKTGKGKVDESGLQTTEAKLAAEANE